MGPDQQQQAQGNSSAQNRRAALVRLLLPILVVTCSVAVAAWLLQTGPKAKPRAKVRNAVMVDVRP
ncbi:MAG: hypothetical protein OEL80_02520, partial [Desulfuromonadales bacterium]|nr:hypothetical protein [Desulfuromonadales bacterium]